MKLTNLEVGKYLVSCCFCRTVGLVARECFWLGEGENRDIVVLTQLLRYRVIDEAIPIAVEPVSRSL
jgi:hypothetical protein